MENLSKTELIESVKGNYPFDLKKLSKDEILAILDNEKAMQGKSNALIENSIARERKYKIDYSSLSTNEQKKVRAKIRRKLFSISDKLILAQKKGLNDEQSKEIRKEMESFSESTYLNADYSQREIFYNGNNPKKIEEINNLLKFMQSESK